MTNRNVSKLRKELESRLKEQRTGERVAPYFVYHCDGCGISKVITESIAPSAMSCALCGNPCRRAWKRPRNYNLEEFKKL